MQRKMAAIWARVSTGGQAELSLDSQIERARAKLEAEGYIVPSDRILAVDWSSLDLFRCPQFQMLRQWIQRKEIAAIGILDRDRLNAVGLQRLIFLADCKDACIKVVICQGPAVIDEPEGQLVELALAIGKERSVKRASQGSKDGLFDKLKLKGVPSFLHKVRGYRWENSRKLVPDEEWPQVNYALLRALQSISTRQIQRELRAQGVSASIPTIWAWLTNPIYGGRYYGHRKEAVEPCQRSGKTYGKSSQRRLPPEEWYYLPEVEVVDPPVNWEEHIALRQRLSQNKLLAQRNGKRGYLLRGRIICDYHQRRYHGQPHHNSWRYTCPTGKDCPRYHLNGPRIETEIKDYCRELLTTTEIVDLELTKYQKGKGSLEAGLQSELKQLEHRGNRSLNEETELEARHLRRSIDAEVYKRLKSRYQAERAWCRERKQEIQEQLENLRHETAAVMSLKEIQQRLGTKLRTATNAEWQEIFTALDLSIHVRENGAVEIEAALPLSNTEFDRDIVLSGPGLG